MLWLFWPHYPVSVSRVTCHMSSIVGAGNDPARGHAMVRGSTVTRPTLVTSLGASGGPRTLIRTETLGFFIPRKMLWWLLEQSLEVSPSLLLGPHNNSWLARLGTRQSAPVPVQCYPGPGFVASLTARSLDRGNNFKVHSHQANPTHDINLRFFTFCKNGLKPQCQW